MERFEEEEPIVLSGQVLNPELVRKGRLIEFEKLVEFSACRCVPLEEARAMNGKWIGSRWEDVLKIDPISGEEIVRSRWVLQDFARSKDGGLFAPNPSQTSARIIDGLAIDNDWPILNADVSTAYMQAEENELVFTMAPQGFEEPGTVWQLLKNINGRRPGAQNWMNHLTDEVMQRVGILRL